tara:strand:- start:13678 stop:13965 length:288 start_codon:yes stop_codon:yes gene_type:complete
MNYNRNDQAYKTQARDLFEDTCLVTMYNRGNSKREMTAEVIKFKEKEYMVALIKVDGLSQSIEASLQYYPRTTEYAGTTMGVEFITQGPNKLVSG